MIIRSDTHIIAKVYFLHEFVEYSLKYAYSIHCLAGPNLRAS